jgi:hypothetical protein
MRNNSKDRRAWRQGRAEARLADSKPCSREDCTSVHVDEGKAHA